MGIIGGSIFIGAVIIGVAISSGCQAIAFRLSEIARALKKKNIEEIEKHEQVK